MDQVYADLLTLLNHAAQSELPEGMTEDNVRYIKSVVECARNGAIIQTKGVHKNERECIRSRG